MKRVAIISNAPSPYRVDHYEYLQNNYKGYEFYFIYARKNNKSNIRQWDVSTDKLFHVVFLPCYMILKKGKYDNRQIFITYGVGKKMNEICPDVVVSMEYNPTSLQAMRWCKKRHIPYVSHTDGTLYSERNINKIQKIFRNYIIKNSTTFIASSTKAKEKILSYRTEKPIFLSFISADLNKYYFKKEYSNNKTLICVGSLIERKGIDLLLKAMTMVNKEIFLKIVGAGGQREELENMVKELELSDRIEFMGYRQQEELFELYKQADAFVLPTREDCYGLVILEAMAASLPVISSNYADGAFDLVHDGEDGYIVDPYNTVEFAKKIEDCFNNNDNNCMGLKAYHSAHNFDFKKVSSGYMKAIDVALENSLEKNSNEYI